MSNADFNSAEWERAVEATVERVRKAMTLQMLIDDPKLEIAAWACAKDHRISCVVELVLQFILAELGPVKP